MPIYVAPVAATTSPIPSSSCTGVVAGAPPDHLGPEGQLWGNPLFDWEAMAADGYRWWIERLRRMLRSST